jgi:hypothetical protein
LDKPTRWNTVNHEKYLKASNEFLSLFYGGTSDSYNTR